MAFSPVVVVCLELKVTICHFPAATGGWKMPYMFF